MALPNSTARITPKEYDLSRVQDNVARVLDAVLGLLNAALSYNSKTKVLTVAAPTAVVNNLTSTGALTSSTGFKAVVGPFTYWNAGTGNTGGTMRYTVYDNVGSTGVFNLSFVAPFAGSILAVSANLNSSITQVTTVTANVAGGSSLAMTIASGSTSGSATASKGTKAFTAGQLLNVTISWPLSQTFVVCSAFIVIEMAA